MYKNSIPVHSRVEVKDGKKMIEIQRDSTEIAGINTQTNQYTSHSDTINHTQVIQTPQACTQSFRHHKQYQVIQTPYPNPLPTSYATNHHKQRLN